MDLLAPVAAEVPRYHDDVYLRTGDAIELHGKLLVVESRCRKPLGYVFSEVDVPQVEHPIASADIKAWHEAGKLTFVSKTEFGLPIGVRQNLRRSLRAFTRVERREIVRRLRYCRALDDLGRDFSRSDVSLQPVCDRIAAERDDTGPHDWSSVYRWWRNWTRAGRDPRALCSNAAKRGNRDRRFEPYQIKAMREAIESDYLRRHRPNATTAHKACVSNIIKALGGPDKASAVVAEMATNKDPAKRSPFPSLKAFRAECKRVSRVIRTDRRRGPDAARQEISPVGAGPQVNFAFERVEADFKYLRLFVVDEEHDMPLGTPFLMAAVDCYSGCVAGWDIGFDPPSYVSAARCLKHVIGYKDTAALGTDEDGQPRVRNAYPVNGVPFHFFVDNDQVFHSASFVHTGSALGCHVDYVPPSQSWKKGRIERFWGTVQECFLDMFPGKVLRYGDDPGRDYKPDDDAVISLAQLRLFVTKAIVDVYNQEVDPQSGERRIDRWCASAELRPPRRVRAHDDLIELVGAYEQRKAERRGLRLFGLRYNSPELARYRAGFEKDPRVEVRYDPQELGHVTLVDHDKGFTLRVPCTRPDYAEGLTLHQHRVIRRRATDASPKGRIRMGALLMAKAELFELGKAMIKARRGRRKLTKVAQFLGLGREVIDLMARRRVDKQESDAPLELTEPDVHDAVHDAEDNRRAVADESLVETYRSELQAKPGPKPRTPRNKARPKTPSEPQKPIAPTEQAPVPSQPPSQQPPRSTTRKKVSYD
ncbi:Mu transposase C-terminal domain-containing protein [Methylobacterium aerolatum]|uniref:Transposase n=1 Tax=Methylobacterium aerolatum TaxID=418708 RepID=A0ABU0HVQ0_9HYPH|nr:Mu transposase C-terminal domain-containing protein [Methylobacterium aerolatum]MDQ0446371.1 putative transposase [Methylobacterium aerolatum]GJD33466.1 hypothetical protein FMGBMHLM_0353 [Methylobacterium aerolatum]